MRQPPTIPVSAPPFALRRVAPRLSLPPLFGDDLDRVQFCTGASYDERREVLRLTYGVGDCGAAATELPLQRVVEALL